MKTRTEVEQRERETLASYAQKSGDSAGRFHGEPPHPFRTEYERDRARIVHSRSFRRLEYKTQVFLNGTGDHLRTRLTHTIEVASLSRTISRALALNEDLAEAISLAHDLGHAPFGHSGEETLDELMRGHGGFDHNAQSLRVVELIERKYPRFPGLNLSAEVREGLCKHPSTGSADPAATTRGYRNPTLEAQIADLADEVTYYSHDLDDGLEFDLITAEQLLELTAWRESLEEVRRHFPTLQGRALSGYTIRCMIDRQVQDVITTSAGRIETAQVRSAEEVREHPERLVSYSDELRDANCELRSFLYANLYFHPTVADVNERACEMLRNVFNAYLARPELLGETTTQRLNEEGLYRTVCDYLSGMTDRYLLEEHARLFQTSNEPLRVSAGLGSA